MPLHRVRRKGKWGWKWGKKGKAYFGTGAKSKALKQARAIKASQNKRK